MSAQEAPRVTSRSGGLLRLIADQKMRRTRRKRIVALMSLMDQHQGKRRHHGVGINARVNRMNKLRKNMRELRSLVVKEIRYLLGHYPIDPRSYTYTDEELVALGPRELYRQLSLVRGMVREHYPKANV